MNRRSMARPALMLVLFLGVAPAAHAAEAARAVSLNLNATPLPAALARVEQASGLHLAFSNDLVNDAEPVTLKAENEPVDDVLRAILRPRGLECIYTGETMAAIVRADSDIGTAKAAGRTIRTLALLAAKIESARQQGNEIVMPEWTDGDDRTLCEAFVDLSAFKTYRFWKWQQQQRSAGHDQAYASLLPLLQCFDPDVLLGAAATKFTGWTGPAPNDQQKREVADAIAAMARRPDPLVRAAAVVVGATRWDVWRHDTFGFEQILLKAVADDTPEVRLAAAIVSAHENHSQFYDDLLQTLRADKLAIVRAMAWSGLLQPWWKSASPAEISPGLRDPHPIVRTLCLDHLARLLRQDFDIERGRMEIPELISILAKDREDLMAALRASGAENDPWLKLAAEAFLTRGCQEWQTVLHPPLPADAPKPPIPPEFARQLEGSGTTIANLLASGKASHRILACWTMLEWCSTYGRSADYPGGALIAASPETRHLPTRLVSIVACSGLEPAAAEPRLLQALKSDDELERATALWACDIAQPHGTPQSLHEPVISLLRGKRPLEIIFAAPVVAMRFPPERSLVVFEEQCRREPVSPVTKALLNCMLLPARWQTEAGRKQQLLALDAVLETHNAALQSDYLRAAGGLLAGNEPLFLAWIDESEPDAFRELLVYNANQERGYPFGQRLELKPHIIDAILARLERVARNPDGKPDLQTLRAAAVFAEQIGRPAIAGAKGVFFRVTVPFLEQCQRPDAPDAEIAVAGDLLKAMVYYAEAPIVKEISLEWGELPLAVHASLRTFLGYAGRKAHTGRVAELLALCYAQLLPERRARLEPGIAEAMEKARAEIMRTGSPADQVAMLMGMARRDEATVAELQARLIAGTVPPELTTQACKVLLWRKKSSEFLRFLIGYVGDVNQDFNARRELISMLVRDHPEVYEPLIATLTALADRDEQVGLAEPLEALKAKVEPPIEGKPRPAWVKSAADLALKATRREREKGMRLGIVRRDYIEQRDKAMAAYVAFAGPEAAATIEAMILDGTLGDGPRATAAAWLIRSNPETKLLPELVRKYDMLPLSVRQALGKALEDPAQHGIPGAADFLGRYRNDKEVPGGNGGAK